ncbi:MAG: glycosyltransferase family 4 protein [Actinobacteria bacterium]|nr:glycosyltransferase family 4 protein [Actinomycetota bacterium]MCG2807705.1 glycosyltransferase family 4 protein [Coriobacteriia bacterium]
MTRTFESSSFVFVSSRTGSVMGRVERRLLRVMEALIAAEARVYLICTPRSPIQVEAQAIGVEIAPYHLDKLNYFKTRSRVRKYLERYQPLAVHSTGLEADLIVRWATHEMRTVNVNSMTCIDYPRQGSSGFSRAVRRWLDDSSRSKADAMIVDCEATAARLREAGYPAERIVLDPPSIDVAEVIEQSEQPFRLPPARVSGPVIGYGGRIEDSRGLEVLVAASAILVARGAAEEVLIAGEGPLLRQLKSDIQSSRVRYLGWVDSVPAALKRFDIALFPSTKPGVPTSLLEAAVLGRPIIASRVEGISELFEDPSEIKLVKPGDPKALAAAVAELIADPEAARAMGERARLRTIDEYSSAASVQRHLALYRRFMKE